jgi:hypothetical protein
MLLDGIARKRLSVPGIINCLPKVLFSKSVLNEYDRRLGTIRTEGSGKG